MKQSKKIKHILEEKNKHWVGDGFHVNGLLRPAPEINEFISPFILVDYAAPKEFIKSDVPRGVGEHPHRGFETVTFAYQGEVEHRDSAGGGGIIKPGDIQWMTAGSGLVHDEFHSKNFSQTGGVFEMVQLWVNLPKTNKMTSPRYQGIAKENIPFIYKSATSNIRLIAGEYNEHKGPAKTFSEINIFDTIVTKSEDIVLNLKNGTNTVLLVLQGELEINEKKIRSESALIFEREGDFIQFKASAGLKAMILNGVPINEPMVAHGPFVMNTREEVSQAIRDFQNGKMGNL